MRLKEHKDALVRKSVIALIPLLAQSEPATFASTHLAACMNHLLSQLKKDKERAPGLCSLSFFLSLKK
jgi:FKBP12-rapamycin complex-associated protein